jgi:hypothetical protein
MALATRVKPAPHQKKRQGGHHRHSKHYLKAYWPYIPMLLIVGLGLLVSSIWNNNQHVLGVSSDLSASSLLKYTNIQRQKNNEPALTLNNNLMSAAQAKAENMVQKNYWSHTSPSGQTPWSFIIAAGYNYQLAGENLAYGFSSAQAAIIGWMNSPEHRANILTSAYQNVGFGVASSPNYQNNGPETVVVAEYAEPALNSNSISFTVPKQTVKNSTVKPTEISAQPVSRIQLLSGGNNLASIVVAVVTGAALMFILIKYGIRFKRAVRISEAFFVHHPLLDTVAIFAITVGYVLTRSSGFIR